MSVDYIVLAVVAVLAIGGGLFLISQSKSYRAKHTRATKGLPPQPAH